MELSDFCKYFTQALRNKYDFNFWQVLIIKVMYNHFYGIFHRLHFLCALPTAPSACCIMQSDILLPSLLLLSASPV